MSSNGSGDVGGSEEEGEKLGGSRSRAVVGTG